MNTDSLTTKDASTAQEKYLAGALGGRIPANSGGTKMGGGDILTDKFLIEAKTTMSEKTSFSIKKAWLEKAKEQAFEQGKLHSALAFQFKPSGDNYFIVSEQLFKDLLDYLEDR